MAPPVPLHSSINTHLLHFPSSLFPFALPFSLPQPRSSHSLAFSMFCAAEEDVRFCWPVLESGFSPAEIQELLSLFQDGEPLSSNSGSQGSNRAVPFLDDERRRKRMVSNRESARRSRLRKKKHLENLTVQVNRLKMKNQELKCQLSGIMNRYNMVRKQNERLRSEYVALHARLSDLHRLIFSVTMQRVSPISCMQTSLNLYS